MKRLEFIAPQKINVIVDGKTFQFNSKFEMLGFFEDVKNTEEWAQVHNTSVYHCHVFDKIGKRVDIFDNVQQAQQYADELNEYFGICEEYVVEELEEVF